MQVVLRRTAPILASVPFIGMATGALFLLIALELERADFSNAMVGVVTAAYYLGSVTGTVFFGRIVRRIGFRSALFLCLVGLAASTLALSNAATPTSWLLLRFVGGVALGSTYVVTDSWLACLAGPQTRGRLLASYEVLRLGAVSLGPIVLVMAPNTYGFFYATALYGMALVGPLLAAGSEVGGLKVHTGAGLAEMLLRFWPILALPFCAGFSNAAFYGLGSLYALEQGLSVAQVTIFVSVVLASPLLSAFPAGAMADRFSPMMAATLFAALACCASTAMALAPPSTIWGLGILGVLVGGFIVPLYMLALAHMADHVSGDRTLSMASAGLVSYMGGGLAGPALSGAIMDVVGASGLYMTIGAATCVATGATLYDWRIRRRRANG